MTAIDRIAVVIPARNEERRLGRALTAVRGAARTLAESAPTVVTDVVVVLDRCTDGTADVLQRFPEVRAVTSTAGMVGAARHRGVGAALGDPAVLTARTWIATTDADSVVPVDWLGRHLAIARDGADLLLGTVVPDPAELDERALAAWTARHPQVDGHPYVHGANLGVRADTYVRAGGFPEVREHEDVLLAAAVRALGGVVVSPAGGPVRTSARTVGRTPGGFAEYLGALQRQAGVGGELSPAGLGQQ
ncbi:glycosyltransferase [Nakamurella deserti]|uniref:glycosyltransferase n=1 Tax=Nakamurella deserti TaxID=2164074 RepID=UPI000DBE8DB7|nr:glycosyltransferase [Nakamurella deserti]